MIIYADVLFILNLAVDYLLLLGVCAAVHYRPPFYRLLLSSVIGAAGSFIILLPLLNIIINLLLKAAICAAMTVVAFPLKNVKSFFRYCAWLFGITFGYCGIMTLIYNIFAPRVLTVNNMAVYADISPLILIISTAVCYLCIKLIVFVAGKLRPANEIFFVEIRLCNRSVSCTALLDTGCNLHDLYSGNPVIVLEKQLAYSLIPNRVTTPDIADAIEKSGAKIRLIPYSAIGGKGMMQAFSAEKAIISQGKNRCETEKITVAISENDFSGEYKALIGEDLAALI